MAVKKLHLTDAYIWWTFYQTDSDKLNSDKLNSDILLDRFGQVAFGHFTYQTDSDKLPSNKWRGSSHGWQLTSSNLFSNQFSNQINLFRHWGGSQRDPFILKSNHFFPRFSKRSFFPLFAAPIEDQSFLNWWKIVSQKGFSATTTETSI
jgi:hypothetical protein